MRIASMPPISKANFKIPYIKASAVVTVTLVAVTTGIAYILGGNIIATAMITGVIAVAAETAIFYRLPD